MRLFVFLALFMLPMTMVQLYSTESYALTAESAQQKTLFNITQTPQNLPDDLSGNSVSKNKNFIVNGSSFTYRSTNHAKNRKAKKVELIKGKRNTQGMQLLSMMLMIKDKSK